MERVISMIIYFLKNQTYKKWEAIVIDDNSVDNSFKYLKELSKDDKDLEFIKTNSKKL